MHFRLGYALELVVVLALGMAYVRWASLSPNAPPLLIGSASQSFGYYARAFLAGRSRAQSRDGPATIAPGPGHRSADVVNRRVGYALRVIDGVGTEVRFRWPYFGERPSLTVISRLIL